jgi:hypothetical protein
MRKILFLGTALFVFTASFAAANVELPTLRADQMFFPVGKTGQKISYAQLATISLKDLQSLTGKKMNFVERLNFKLAQSRMKRSIATDGTIKNKRIVKFFTKRGTGPDSGFHGLGFILGFFLSFLGVVLAYVINDDDDKRNRIKWAWIGLGVGAALYILLWLLLWNSVNNLD